jgi:hypothetical protein
MDYLDPQKQRRHGILLLIGYVCMAVAIIIATVVLVYQAYGFGIDKNGTVIQNGIVFFSSQPNPTKVYLNGTRAKFNTNARVALPASVYKVRMSRPGYQDWQHAIEVNGGSVTHYDYPFLFPKVVKTTTVAPLAAMPGLTTQSPDRRWLITNYVADPNNFTVYDLKNPTKSALTIGLPTDVAGKATASEHWQLVEWADDNQHILLQHSFDANIEYILLDRQNPEQSVNLTKTFDNTPASVGFNNKKYDQYYLYNSADRSLRTASLKATTTVNLLSDVLAYKSYGDNAVVFFTSADAPAGKVLLKQQIGSRAVLLRSFPASTRYIVDLATYNNTPYVVASSVDENKVYIYKDPASQLASHPAQVIVPIQVLRVSSPDYESFSNNAQYILTEHGNQVAIYDIENKNGYNYDLATRAPLDSAQPHVQWMDGDRLTYVSAGSSAKTSMIQILDFDQTNQRSFIPGNPSAIPFFAPDYKYLYSFVAAGNGALLTSTSLLIPTDQ